MQEVTYYFAVTAYDKHGNESGYSNEVATRFTPPYPPRNLMLAPDYTQIELTWQPPDKAAGRYVLNPTGITIDNKKVAGYYVTRDGKQIAVTIMTAWTDTVWRMTLYIPIKWRLSARMAPSQSLSRQAQEP